METKQDQQLILLGKYIENLFKHRINLSLDAMAKWWNIGPSPTAKYMTINVYIVLYHPTDIIYIDVCFWFISLVTVMYFVPRICLCFESFSIFCKEHANKAYVLPLPYYYYYDYNYFYYY